MANLFALIIVVTVAYLIMRIISQKKRELADKEELQREQFLQESKALLKRENIPEMSTLPAQTFHQNYKSFVNRYFTAQGYIISEYAGLEGIDFMGVKEKELIMVRCGKETDERIIKEFIADCTLFIEKNPMFSNRSVKRIYTTPHSSNDPKILNFFHDNPQSIQLLVLRMEN